MAYDYKKLYTKTIIQKHYNYNNVEAKFKKLNLDTAKYDLFQVKSAIVYLSRFENEIDSIIDDTNKNVLSILNAATVKEERDM